MQVARPPDGFRIVVRPEVQQYIDAETKLNVRIEQFWKDILDRIKFTALQESHPLPSEGAPKFVFVASGSVDSGVPTIQIVFECFADTLTILAALVWNEDDYEDSAE